MTAVSPSFPKGAQCTRTEQETRSMLDVIRAGARPLPKPCPFCGADAPLPAKIGPRFVVACMNDDCDAIAQASASTPEDAMRIWNNRR